VQDLVVQDKIPKVGNLHLQGVQQDAPEMKI